MFCQAIRTDVWKLEVQVKCSLRERDHRKKSTLGRSGPHGHAEEVEEATKEMRQESAGKQAETQQRVVPREPQQEKEM